MSVIVSRADGVVVLTMTSDPSSRWPPLCQIIKYLCCTCGSQRISGLSSGSMSVLGVSFSLSLFLLLILFQALSKVCVPHLGWNLFFPLKLRFDHGSDSFLLNRPGIKPLIPLRENGNHHNSVNGTIPRNQTNNLQSLLELSFLHGKQIRVSFFLSLFITKIYNIFLQRRQLFKA